MQITQGIRRAAQVNGEGIATVDIDRQRTWSEFTERIARLAGALQALGLAEDGRVAVLALNSDHYLEYFFAVSWAGGIIVPLNTRLASPELAYMLNDAGPGILVVDDVHKAVLPDILSRSSTIKHVIFAGDNAPDGMVSHEKILAMAEPVPDAGRGSDDVAGIFYTGGTTGLSRGVMLTHGNIVSNALAAVLNLHDGEPWTYLHAAPMFHIADCQWNVGVTLLAGTHAFIPKFAPDDMLSAVEQYRATHCALVPTMVNMLCNFEGKATYDVSSLRGINYGGSPMPLALIAKARSAFPHCRLFQGYGQTETAPNITMLTDDYHTLEGPLAAKVDSAGQAVLTMEVRIVDAGDEPVVPGTVGEIVTRGPNVMAGYWNRPEETAHALRGGWMHTGDLGYVDEDGFVYVMDRLKDMIITGGENVYSAEVENVIYEHPAVAVCAVIGIPDEKWGEAVHAIIVPRDGKSVSGDEIVAFCREHIAGYKCPRSVVIRQEPLPVSGAGKVLKRELRAPFWEGKTRQVN